MQRVQEEMKELETRILTALGEREGTGLMKTEGKQVNLPVSASDTQAN